MTRDHAAEPNEHIEELLNELREQLWVESTITGVPLDYLLGRPMRDPPERDDGVVGGRYR